MESEPTPHINPLCQDKELRIAPSRLGKPVANFWRYWVEGNEVYAICRSGVNAAKISVHQSGQIHVRIEGRDLQPLAPPLVIGNGQWLHAFELRFLISEDAFQPTMETMIGKRGLIIDAPLDTVPLFNLLVGQTGTSAATELPHELLPAAERIWQTNLKDGRPVVLTMRLMDMDDHNRDQLKQLRHKLTPSATFTGPLTGSMYMEIWNYHWDAKGGNVVLVVPMGKEAFRSQGNPSSPIPTDDVSKPRIIAFSSPSTSIPITAPNGAIVGTLTIAGITSELALHKNLEMRGSLGTVTLSIDPSNLISGEKFQTRRILCPCVPSIDGGQPRTWDYSVFSSFDGTTFRVEFAQLSCSLRNANLKAPMPCLTATEELVLRAPINGLVLVSTPSAQSSSAPLEGGFLLRDS